MQRLDGDIHRLYEITVVELHSNLFGARFASQRLLEGASKLVAQSFAGHRVDVPIGLAGRRLKVLARPSVDVKNIPLRVGENGGG